MMSRGKAVSRPRARSVETPARLRHSVHLMNGIIQTGRVGRVCKRARACAWMCTCVYVYLCVYVCVCRANQLCRLCWHTSAFVNERPNLLRGTRLYLNFSVAKHTRLLSLVLLTRTAKLFMFSSFSLRIFKELRRVNRAARRKILLLRRGGRAGARPPSLRPDLAALLFASFYFSSISLLLSSVEYIFSAYLVISSFTFLCFLLHFTFYFFFNYSIFSFYLILRFTFFFYLICIVFLCNFLLLSPYS